MVGRSAPDTFEPPPLDGLTLGLSRWLDLFLLAPSVFAENPFVGLASFMNSSARGSGFERVLGAFFGEIPASASVGEAALWAVLGRAGW